MGISFINFYSILNLLKYFTSRVKRAQIDGLVAKIHAALEENLSSLPSIHVRQLTATCTPAPEYLISPFLVSMGTCTYVTYTHACVCVCVHI